MFKSWLIWARVRQDLLRCSNRGQQREGEDERGTAHAE